MPLCNLSPGSRLITPLFTYELLVTDSWSCNFPCDVRPFLPLLLLLLLLTPSTHYVIGSMINIRFLRWKLSPVDSIPVVCVVDPCIYPMSLIWACYMKPQFLKSWRELKYHSPSFNQTHWRATFILSSWLIQVSPTPSYLCITTFVCATKIMNSK